MRKYNASNLQRVNMVILLLYPLSTIIVISLGSYHLVYEKQGNLFLFLCLSVFFVAAVYAFIALIIIIIDDPILGRFSFDEKGITFYTPRRTITFLYDECAEIGFTRWRGLFCRYNYYIYFSKRTLTEEQRAYLFERSKKKRGKRNRHLYQSEYVLFQYRPDIFSSFIESVPERFKRRLIITEKNLNLKKDQASNM